jgi:hypothetical protein
MYILEYYDILNFNMVSNGVFFFSPTYLPQEFSLNLKSHKSNL